MRQTLAIFLDAYRELNSKRLFWFVLAISILVVLVFASMGISKHGLTVLWMEFDVPYVNSDLISPERFYKQLFSQFGLKVWLTWIATVLALISTAAIIPDFIAGGAIELTLSKPIGRLRLFLTKWATGMLFVTLQVTVFTFASFMVIGLRGGAWLPGLFLAIPIVVLFFSYLSTLCTLFGLVTRSTIAALLLTLLCWFVLWGTHAADQGILFGREQNAVSIERQVASIKKNERVARQTMARLAAEDAPEGERATREKELLSTYTDVEVNKQNPLLQSLRDQLAKLQENREKWLLASNIAVAVKTVLPKTADTAELLDRTLVSTAELEKQRDNTQSIFDFDENSKKGEDRRKLNDVVQARVLLAVRERSLGWVLGTSLAFEAAVLGLACWIFCRREF